MFRNCQTLQTVKSKHRSENILSYRTYLNKAFESFIFRLLHILDVKNVDLYTETQHYLIDC